MPRRIRVGVVGTSWWTQFAHLPALKSHPGAEVVAICGRNHENAVGVSQKFAIPLVFTDYREMIAKGGLDAITVSTPDDTHLAIVMAALDAGLHVLCEKPMALNAADALTMYKHAESVGVRHMVYFTWHWLPVWQFVHQLLAEDTLGRIFDMHLRFLFHGGLAGNYEWRMDRRRANGTFADLGSHMIELARWFGGDITKVCAHLATFIERPGLDGQPLDPSNDDGTALIEFASGSHGVIHASALAPQGDRRFDQGIVFYGEKGSLDVKVAFYGPQSGSTIYLSGIDDQPIQRLTIPDVFFGGIDQSAPMVTQLDQQFTSQAMGPRLFIDSIIENRAVAPNFYDGYMVQQVIDAALESHQSRCWISVPESGRAT